MTKAHFKIAPEKFSHVMKGMIGVPLTTEADELIKIGFLSLPVFCMDCNSFWESIEAHNNAHPKEKHLLAYTYEDYKDCIRYQVMSRLKGENEDSSDQ